jgi:serine/threonine protein kinase
VVHSPALAAGIVIRTAETPTRMRFRIGAKPRPQRGVRVGRLRRGCINRTTTNLTVSTVAYSAPEQLMGLDIDGRADQYALAATAYHLLTGSQLFPNSNPAVVISRHLNVAGETTDSEADFRDTAPRRSPAPAPGCAGWRVCFETAGCVKLSSSVTR